MNEPAYRIKPLEWQECEGRLFRAGGYIFNCEVEPREDGLWTWHISFGEGMSGGVGPFLACKDACDQVYRTLLQKFLEEV